MAFGITDPPSPAQVTADISRAFKEKYKYRILGRADALFESVSRVLKNDPTLYDAMKRKRTRSARDGEIIKNAGYTEAVQNEKTALNRIEFLKYALKQVTNNRGTASGTRLATALHDMSKELTNAMKQYIVAKGGEENVSSSDPVMIDIRNMHRKLERLDELYKQQLRKENKFFNIDHFRAGQKLDTVKNTLLDILV